MKIIKSFDFFGNNVHFFVSGQRKVYTFLGGTMSLIGCLACSLAFIFLFEDLLKRENPQTTTDDDDPYDQYKAIKFGQEKIYIPFTVADYRMNKVNFTGWLYPVIYYFSAKRDQKTGSMPYTYKILNYKYCNKTSFNTISFYNDSYYDFDSLYCIDMEDLVMGGGYFDDFIYYIQMDFYLCEEGANMNTPGKKCTNITEFEKYIGADNGWHMELYYPVIQFKPKNKNKPIEIIYNVHYYNLNKFNTKIERLYLKQFILVDDQGWIFTEQKNTTLWGFDRFEYDTYSRNSEGHDFITDLSSSKLYSLVIYLNRHRKIYSRKYTKLFDALGNILSIVNVMMVFIKYSTKIFIEANQDRDIFNSVLSLKDKNVNYDSKRLMSKISSNKVYYKINKKDKKFNTNFSNNNFFTRQSNKANKRLTPVFSPDFRNKQLEKMLEPEYKVYDFLRMNIEDNSSELINNNKYSLKLTGARNTIFTNNLNYKMRTNEDKFLYFVNRIKTITKFKTNTFEEEKDKFPYSYYLVNYLSSLFVSKSPLCVKNNFKKKWLFFVNALDVTKFVELQTNVNLIYDSLLAIQKESRKWLNFK